MTTLPCFIVDAFAEKDALGNPAAVVILQEAASEEWMQKTAAEFNLSETAYLVPLADNRWTLRWFTPEVEVPLCGHATLASAYALWEGLKLSAEQWEFTTKSGVLTVSRDEDRLILNFPMTRCDTLHNEKYESVLNLPIVSAAKAGESVLLEVENETALKDFQPDAQILSALSPFAVMITARSQQTGLDFISRFFAPNKGILEDPVTGSAHCALANYWQQKLRKNNFLAKQCSSRGGYLSLEIVGDRVLLSGKANMFMQGELVDQ